MADEPELAHATPRAMAINTKPDFCKVGDNVVPYDIVCDLSRAICHSPIGACAPGRVAPARAGERLESARLTDGRRRAPSWRSRPPSARLPS